MGPEDEPNSVTMLLCSAFPVTPPLTVRLTFLRQGHKAPVTRVCFSSSDRHVASGSRSGEVLVHNVTSGFVTELPTARNEVSCCPT